MFRTILDRSLLDLVLIWAPLSNKHIGLIKGLNAKIKKELMRFICWVGVLGISYFVTVKGNARIISVRECLLVIPNLVFQNMRLI